MHRRITVGAFACAALLAGAIGTSAANAAGRGYNNIPYPLPGNFSSEAFEAQSVSEVGNQIIFATKPNDKPSDNRYGHVVVVLSSWGCQSGHWYSGDCFTKGDAKFPLAITLNLWEAPTSGSLPGAPITSVTRTFSIRYRPSANNKRCLDPDTQLPDGRWYDGSSKTCFNGYATKITFPLDPHLVLPKSIVYGIAYNTTHYGFAPFGESAACFTSSGGCGYDSLNVGESQALSLGSNANADSAFLYSSGYGYCDGGSSGVNVFRLDSGCWSSRHDGPPAVQFKD